jgi:cytochrome c
MSWKHALFGLLCLAACGGAQTEMPQGQATPTSALGAAPQSPDDQVALGQKIYAQKCAECHGANGAGTKDAPPVVGANALPAQPHAGQKRNAAFATAEDVAAFVKKAMPGDSPGTLTDEEVYAVLAFDLRANGVGLDRKVDRAYAGTLRLH